MYLALEPVSDATLVLNAHGTGPTESFFVLDQAFPAPEKRPEVMNALLSGETMDGITSTHEHAVRSIGLFCMGADEPTAEATLICLAKTANKPGTHLVWQSNEGSPIVRTPVLSGDVGEEEMSRSQREQGKILVRLSLVTLSDWYGEGVEWSGTTVVVERGDRPAPFRMKVTRNAAGNLYAFAVKHNADPAYGTFRAGPNTATNLTTAWADLDTPTTFDTEVYKGKYIPFARVSTNASTPANTRLRVVGSTTGSGVPTVMTSEHDSTHHVGAGAWGTQSWHPLPGPLRIPTGGVPGIDTPGGYGAEGNIASVTTGNELDVTQTLNPTYATRVLSSQSITLAHGQRLKSLSVPFDVVSMVNAHYHVVVTAGLWATRSWAQFSPAGALRSQTFVLPGSVGTHTATFDLGDFVVPSSGEYYLVFHIHYDDTPGSEWVIRHRYSATDVYADGSRVARSTPYADMTGDYRFTLTGQTLLAFTASVAIQGRCSESSKTATLNGYILMPIDHWCASYPHSFAAGDGLLFEAADPKKPPVAYLTTSTAGTAGVAVAPTVWYGYPSLAPGRNYISIVGSGTVTLSGTYYPCYSNAAAGVL